MGQKITITNFMKGIGDSTTVNFTTLFAGTKKFIVPRFQRDYSWDTENWDELWQDIQAVNSAEEEEHYMGYLVLLTRDGKTHDIIDGQQRLTTLSLLILAVLKNLQKLVATDAKAGDRIELIKKFFIGEASYVDLHLQNKLELNRNNKDYYIKIVEGSALPNRGIKPSERLIKRCYEWYDKKISDLNYNSKELADLVNVFTNKLFFTQIIVTDELNAYKVFETLNARGVKLSSTDLLKNYLFQIVSSSHRSDTALVLDRLEVRWNAITDKLANDEFPEFLRVFWNSWHKTVRKANLYKAIRNDITQPKQALELVNQLENKVDIYKALLTPHDTFWTDKKITENLETLKLFNVFQPLSLLLIAHEKLPLSEFKKILDYCIIVSFRYNIICGLNPNEQENVYNRIAVKISDGKKVKIVDFKDVYPSDITFYNSFKTKELKYTTRNMGIARYILSPIEDNLAAKPISRTDQNVTIEHILPLKKEPKEWAISDEEFNKCVNRLGNFTLLSKGLQSKAANHGYGIKKVVYKGSTINITKKISEDFNVWNEKSIDSRQEWMAKQAKAIWKMAIPK